MSSVSVATGPVDVAVRELFGGGIAHVDDGDLEVQGLARERMIAVDLGVVSAHSLDREDARAARAAELQALADLRAAVGEFAHGHVTHEARFVVAVAFFRRDVDVQARTDVLPLERFLEPGYDVARA